MTSLPRDEFGPEKILRIKNTKIGLHAYVVIDNTVLGPGKGGVRMSPTVTLNEVARLARIMTWKCSLAELPFGGAKAGIVADDKKITKEKKNELVRAFANAIRSVTPEKYIAAPDMNMGEEEMAIIAEVLGPKACTGKPKSMGGLPHELGSTGFGVHQAVEEAAKFMGLELDKMTFAVEGFGNVGTFVAKFLTERSHCKFVAVSDSKGCLYNKDGIDFDKMMKVKQNTGSVINYKPGKVIPNKEIISLDVDVLIPAAVPDLIVMEDVNKVKAKLIVEGSNIPMSFEVESKLHEKGIVVIPDFLANAGGVISSYVEYKGGNEKEVFDLIKEKISKNTKIVLEKSNEAGCIPRECALEIAKQRILEKMK